MMRNTISLAVFLKDGETAVSEQRNVINIPEHMR